MAEMTEQEYNDFVDSLPVVEPPDFAGYRTYVADCLDRNEEPLTLGEWQETAGEVSRAA